MIIIIIINNAPSHHIGTEMTVTGTNTTHHNQQRSRNEAAVLQTNKITDDEMPDLTDTDNDSETNSDSGSESDNNDSGYET